MNKPIRTLLYILLSAFIGVLIYQFLSTSQKIYITHPSPSIPATGCDSGYLYDAKGKSYLIIGNNFVEYQGSGPLYELSEDALKYFGDDTDICFQYPNQVPPSFVISSGQQVFPIQISLTPENTTVKKGSSIVIVTSIRISDTFTKDTAWTNLPIDQETVTEFSLDAPNFDISPSNADSKSVFLSHSHEANYKWVVAPLERAQGSQSLGIGIYSDYFVIDIVSSLEVQPIIGINALVVALIAASGSFLIGFMTIAEKTINIWKMFSKPTKYDKKRRKANSGRN